MERCDEYSWKISMIGMRDILYHMPMVEKTVSQIYDLYVYHAIYPWGRKIWMSSKHAVMHNIFIIL